ncbi:XRE family transcriptional regulator [Amycolatopsis sp. PS_44_ISF1]|uniref:XRE family transcriptional regulator n=1 Tax=Amycolatopsis sp. PS_44_ISF1 TaxID=2974917 RepID=UPI0028DE1A94|nr:XRE family transcriptional regulator [Amycolatopsis sp. PS_44_ISF1]MDT8913174.1 XRE family transcriptional regulator [Amycolatopsis sp. PS_44_ISF1]
MHQQHCATEGAARRPPGALPPAVRFGPFHRALSEAVDHRGLSLSRLRAHLATRGVSVAESTLSYWQRGLRHPSAARSLGVVRALEAVLGLPSDSLVVLIGPHRAPGDGDRRPSLPELQQSWTETCALLEELSGLPRAEENADLDVVTVVDVLSLDADGRTGEITSTMVVRARRSGADSFLVTHQDEPGSDVTATTVVTVDGCRMGRLRRNAPSAGMVFELLFDRGLAAGETHTFAFTLRLDAAIRATGFQRVVRAPMSAYLLRLRFDAARLPARCLKTIRPREDLEPLLSEPLFCGPGATASAYFEDLGVGIAGVDLIWD